MVWCAAQPLQKGILAGVCACVLCMVAEPGSLRDWEVGLLRQGL